MKKFLFILAMIAASSLCNAQSVKLPCKAITKSGKQCAGRAGANGYCFVHNPDAARCGALKADKTTCRFLVKKPGDRCRYHK